MKKTFLLRFSGVGLLIAGLIVGLHSARPAHAQAPAAHHALWAGSTVGPGVDVATFDGASRLPSLRLAVTSTQGNTSLQDLMLDYWTWALGGNQPDHKGSVAFLPIPPGEGYDEELMVYVGEMDHTLKKNESFFLPIFVFYGERYLDESEDPPGFPPAAAFTGAEVEVTLDGDTIVDSDTQDMADYYTDTSYFKLAIEYDEPTFYGSTAAIWIKGLGFTRAPMAKGSHTLHLLITSDFLTDNYGFAGWANTWNLTVE